MKFMRLAACAVAFAVVGGMAVAEDMDIKALQAKLAAQEARLNDLQAKMGSGAAEAPASIISMRKNAKVTIGGDLDVRYVYDNYEVERNYDLDDGVDHDPVTAGTQEGPDTIRDWHQTNGWNKGNLFIDTADLRIGVEVNEHMDAFMRIGSHDTTRGTGIMRDAWVRWKNICNSGWGILVGRNGLQFGLNKPVGMFDSWQWGDSAQSGWAPAHLNQGVARTTQVNPYWESQDGKFRFDFSLFQGLETRNGTDGTLATNHGILGEDESANWGLGSGAIKLQWKPTEDWTFVASFAHFYADAEDGDIGLFGYGDNRKNSIAAWSDADNSKSNSAFHLGFIYNPAAFCKNLTVWGLMQKEYNTGFMKDRDYFTVNAGLAYKFNEKLTGFVMGDYVNSSNYIMDYSLGDIDGWRSYLGVNYNLGGGANIEFGWSHEELDWECNNAGEHKASVSGNSLYSRLAFSF